MSCQAEPVARPLAGRADELTDLFTTSHLTGGRFLPVSEIAAMLEELDLVEPGLRYAICGPMTAPMRRLPTRFADARSLPWLVYDRPDLFTDIWRHSARSRWTGAVLSQVLRPETGLACAGW